MHRKEYGSQALPLKSVGLHRVCAGALRLIWALLFTEVSKTAAEKQGAQLPCHSVSCPRAPAAACHFAMWLFVCLRCFLVVRTVSEKSKEQHVSRSPKPSAAYLEVLNHEASPQLLETLQAQGEILLEVGKGGRNWSTTSSGQEISIYNPSSFIQSSHMQSS